MQIIKIPIFAKNKQMNILENYNLKPHNTFGFEAIAKQYTEITTDSELVELYEDGRLRNNPFFILGGGSNVLFTKDYDGLIIRMMNKGFDIVAEDASHVIVTVAAGEVWEEFVYKMVDLNYGGIENLALIPGLCGSCAVQNIGAYGVEICDTLQAIRYFDLETGEFKIIENSDCNYGYRDSIFKHELKDKVIITDVAFKLTKIHQLNTSYGAISQELTRKGIASPTIKDVSEIVKEIRRSKLPDVKELGNAGSFFKNPYVTKEHLSKLREQFPQLISYPVNENMEKLAAGQLIELCGWKGKQLGHVGVHTKQALILVHFGGGKGEEIVSLSNAIIEDVWSNFEVKLSPEVIFV